MTSNEILENRFKGSNFLETAVIYKKINHDTFI